MRESNDKHNPKKNHSEIINYQKINIFGDEGVGKTTLISYMENYNCNNFQIIEKIEGDSKISIKSYNNTCSLVEQIKRIEISFKENKNLYFNVYETNLDRYDYIKMNLDTLLLQTECIIIMWDKSKSDTFDNIPNLISTINVGIKEKKFRDVPIFLIQNKIDLEIRDSIDNELENNIKDSIKKIKNDNKNIIYKEISLLEKNDFYHLISDINKSINNSKKLKESLNNYNNSYLVKFKNFKNISNEYEIIDNNITINCVLLGHPCVGKTTFFNYFHNQKIENENIYFSTISVESLFLLAEVNNEKIYVKIYDTAGQERYNSIAKNYIRNADGILLFFDVTKKESFEDVEKWISTIEDTIGNDSEVMLIANKIDVADNRVIYKKDGKEKANKYNLKYFECSCLNGINLYEILKEIILAGYYKYYEKNPSGIKLLKTIKLNEKKNISKSWSNYCNDYLPSFPRFKYKIRYSI